MPDPPHPAGLLCLQRTTLLSLGTHHDKEVMEAKDQLAADVHKGDW